MPQLELEEEGNDVELTERISPSRRLREPPAPLPSHHCTDEDREADSDNDDEQSELSSMDGLAPLSTASWVLLMLPFLLLAVGLGIAYAGRRQHSLLAELDPEQLLLGEGGISNSLVSDTADGSSMFYPLHQPLDIVVQGISSNQQYNVSGTAAEQIKSYRQDKALIIHIQVENQAGHAICSVLGNNTPGPDCWQLKDKPDPDYPYYYPWLHRDTAANAAVIRSYFDLISWRLNRHPAASDSASSLSDTNWEHPAVLSIFVARDPLTRMLAYDQKAAELWPAVYGTRVNPDQAHAQWWAFARSLYTDNFALRALTTSSSSSSSSPSKETTCCHGSHTPKKFLEQAKSLLERFSIILDMDCLDEGLRAVADLLGLDEVALPQKKNQISAQERIPDEIYEYLRTKNQMDIDLYEFAKSRSLVQCKQQDVNGE